MTGYLQGRVLGHAGYTDDKLHQSSVERGRIPRGLPRWDGPGGVPVGSQAADRLLEVSLSTSAAHRHRAAPIYAGKELLGALIFTSLDFLEGAVVRTLERAALVTALER